jgi:hypothetical protein
MFTADVFQLPFRGGQYQRILSIEAVGLGALPVRKPRMLSYLKVAKKS